MKPVEDYSDAELQAILSKRQQERAAQAKKDHAAYVERLHAALTENMIDALAPTHDCMTCSDVRTNNGWGSASNGSARCVRCALIEVRLSSGAVPFPLRFSLVVQ